MESTTPETAAIDNAVECLKERGATFFRTTKTTMTRELIVEGWKVQPRDQGDEPL